MKRTEFVAMVSAGYIEGKWRRVYVSEDGKYYVKLKNEYVCISGTPAEKMMVKD